MRLLCRKEICILALSVLVVSPALGQNVILDAVTRATTDWAEIRKKAEAGDPVAQVRYGDILTTHMRHAEALEWYEKAAVQGNVAGEFHVGRTLLNGAHGNPKDQDVHPEPVQGLHWSFMAATNHDPNACFDLSTAFQKGQGTDVDLVSAYAWMELYAESLPPYGGRIGLNDLALRMTTAEVERAQKLATEFKAGHWHFPATRVTTKDDPRLKLKGITVSAKQRVAMINGRTFLEGDVEKMDLKSGNVTVKCLKIESNSVTVSVEGESELRVLRLAP